MKNFSKFILFCTVVLLAITLVWLFGKQATEKPVSMVQISDTNLHSADLALPPTNSLPGKTNIETQNEQSNVDIVSVTPIQSNSVPDATQKRVQMLQKALTAKNVPLDFYGAVIDENSNFLSGVKIKVTVRHWGFTKNDISTEIPIERMTDETGRFKLDGATGDVFDIDYIQKAGYELEPNTKPGFGVVSGSFDSPVIFKMWSTNIHEPLITGEKRFHVAIDGQAYFINLTEGAISQDQGDLKIWIKFPAETNAEQRNNWLAEIDAVNGGLLEEHDPYSSMYLAPEGNYTQAFQIARQLVRKNQRGMTGQHRFYLTLKNGKEYGRFSVELFAPYNDQIPGLIDIKYAINPSGSRILR
jgi:hypothetical protein